MFIGRKKELTKLNKMYNQDTFQCAIIYGRRRVGKTFLITQFLKGKNAVYFAAEEYSSKVLLDKFSDLILKKIPSKFFNSFDSFEKAVSYLGEKSVIQRLIIVIDEFQYWAYQNKGIISALQNLIDHQLKDTKLFIILCGSYISFMEKEILGYRSPLYGRRTGQFKIEPFDFFDASLFLKGYGFENRMLSYSVLGGVPQYLRYFNVKKSLKDNIIENILDKNAFLHEEPYFLLKQALKEPAVYFSVIEAVATGYTKYNEISTKIGTDCGFYINTLIELNILKREIPAGAKKTSRKSIYKINDNFFRFWFRFVADAAALIEQEKYEILYNERIQDHLSEYAGEIFEEVCIQYLKRVNGKGMLPFTFYQIGKWWGSNKYKKKQEEIDIVALDGKENVLFAECKWRNEPVDKSTVENLVGKGRIFSCKNKYYMVFCKSGFTRGAKEYAERNLIKCLIKDQLFLNDSK